MQVSDIEKKPEPMSSAANATNSQPSAMVSVMRRASAALQDQLEHDLAADVREQQCRKPGERPVDRLAAAPAAEVMPVQQRAEDAPRDEPEDRLVVGLERPPEELLGEEHARDEREREQHESR